MNKKSGNKILIIIAAVLLVVVIAAAGTILGLYLGNRKDNDHNMDSASEAVLVEESKLDSKETEEKHQETQIDQVVKETDTENADEKVEETKEKVDDIEHKLNVRSAEVTSELDVVSSDKATYHPDNLYDGSFSTAWLEGVEGNGVGERIILKLDDVHIITKVKIYNGFLKTKRRYAINGKVSRALIDYGNGNQEEISLKIMDVPEEETGFDVSELGETEIIPKGEYQTDEITITILDAVEGSKYSDTAVSEVEIYGY